MGSNVSIKRRHKAPIDRFKRIARNFAAKPP
jgi:hypothetical protein